MKKRTLLILALVIGFLGSPPLQAASSNFPDLTGRVVDQANVLDEETKHKLTVLLTELESKTTIQLVVATVESLEGHAIEEYSIQLARNWKLGQREKNNGVLLLLAPNEREVRIEVGYGLEGVLTDANSTKIIQEVIIPAMKGNDPNKALLEGANAIASLFDPNLDELERPEEGTWWGVILLIFIFGAVVLFAFRRGFIKRSNDNDSSNGGGGGFSGGGGSFGGGGSSGKY